jgi:hypothetical protein
VTAAENAVESAPAAEDSVAAERPAIDGAADLASQAPVSAPAGTGTASLEQSLANTERDAESTLKAAATVTSALKWLRTAAHAGNLRDLQSAFASAEQALQGLRQDLANARRGWDFDEEAYFASGAFPRELLQMAEQMGLRIFEQDDRL